MTSNMFGDLTPGGRRSLFIKGQVGGPMAETIPAELQEKIRQLQAAGQQVQMLAQQRSQMEAMANESRRALEALEAVDSEAAVYRNLGSLMVSEDRDHALERLKDEAETLDVRLKRVKEQENSLSEQLKALEAEIQKALQE